MSMHSMKEIQAALAALGLYHDDVDGIIGPNTRAAVAAFQRSVNIDDDGIPGNQTQAHLFPVGVIPSYGRDLDPPVAEPAWVAPIWPRQNEIERYYGKVGENQVKLILPFPMKLDWEEKTVIHSFQIHEKVHDSALRCFNRIADAYDEAARAAIGIDLFGGCLNVRKMRGGTKMSMHSWGIAIDFSPEANSLHQNHTTARLAEKDCDTFWKIWEGEGWVSLGRTRDFDWMHVQAARL